jgi:hypothetical protein
MSDQEGKMREALKGVLDPITPPGSLPTQVIRRARTRRALSATLMASAALMLVVGVAWGAIAIRDAVESPADKEVSPVQETESDLALYLSGDGELWRVDLDGAVRHVNVPELSPGDPTYRIVRRENQLVGWGYKTLLLDPELEADPSVLVPDSLFFVPSARPDRVWVAIAEANEDTGRLAAVREVSTDGEVTVPDVRPPEGSWPERALDSGLVVFVKGEWVVWDPVRDEIVYRWDANTLGPAHGDLVAWCNKECRSIHITDVSSGEDKMIEPPEDFTAFDGWVGAFSPDGTTLAMPVRRTPEIENYDAERQLALVDVSEGSARVAPNTETRNGYNYVEWSPMSGYVFVAEGQVADDERGIVVYKIGSDAARRLRIETGDFYGVASLLIN